MKLHQHEARVIAESMSAHEPIKRTFLIELSMWIFLAAILAMMVIL